MSVKEDQHLTHIESRAPLQRSPPDYNDSPGNGLGVAGTDRVTDAEVPRKEKEMKVTSSLRHLRHHGSRD